MENVFFGRMANTKVKSLTLLLWHSFFLFESVTNGNGEKVLRYLVVSAAQTHSHSGNSCQTNHVLINCVLAKKQPFCMFFSSLAFFCVRAVDCVWGVCVVVFVRNRRLLRLLLFLCRYVAVIRLLLRRE